MRLPPTIFAQASGIVFVALVTAGCGDDETTSTGGTEDIGVDSPRADVAPDVLTEDLGPDSPSEDAQQDDVGHDTTADANDVGMDVEPDTPALYPAVYTDDRTQSPITPFVAANLQQIRDAVPGNNDMVFSKIGASATMSRNFMHCFAGDDVVLDGRDELIVAIDHFEAGWADGTTPFDRESLCATVGWSAGAALSGDPHPLAQELMAVEPRFAVIMYGTNDIQLGNLYRYADNLLNIADFLIESGVIPIFTSIMPRDDSASADAVVPRYNAVVRAVAQARQVPFIDFHRELVPLPDHGLGGDDLHPSVYRDGGARPCVFTDEGLTHGYNIRNLLTISALERARRIVVDDEPAPDAPGAPLIGVGSRDQPLEIDTLPFSDVRNTNNGPFDEIDTYDGVCNATQDESGPEFLYRLTLTEQTTVTALVFDRGDVDIDIHLLDETGTAAGCVERDHQEIVATLEPGTWYFALDTFVSSSGAERAGEYIFVVIEED